MADGKLAFSNIQSEELLGVRKNESSKKSLDVEVAIEAGSRLVLTDENEEFDPWALPAFKSVGPKWSELETSGKLKRVLLLIIKFAMLTGLLYLFICSLSFLSSAFRLLGGKAAGEAFASNKILTNPVAGLMIGILATVLVQSSSTTTSIVVAMVASSIIEVRPAIPIIMGANIGTSVTNTIVSLAQATERNEFRRAFAGATVHDIFNWLSVLVFLPLEVVSHYLFHLTSVLVKVMDLKTNKGYKTEFLSKLTKPFTQLVIQLDKKVITQIALQKKGAEDKSLIKSYCSKESVVVLENVTSLINETVNGITVAVNRTAPMNITKELKNPCKFLFYDTGLSDTSVGIILLVIALLILCTCLVLIVKLLHSLLRGQIAAVIKRTVNSDFPKPFHHFTGYFALLVGATMTILVQSSSIFTSALTPLIGVGVVTIERAYPLTLGANIGTTGTGILAALASDQGQLDKALQIALCHLFFNISGILLWFPIPCMRRVPINFAKTLGNKTADYRWFAVAYLIFGFFLLPASVFGLSLAGWQILLGVAAPLLLLFLFILVTSLLQRRAPNALPEVLKDWEWAPKWTRSLEPHDKVITKVCEISKGRCGIKRTKDLPDLETCV
ncbi:predicted protein [Nematostella vectensis]|uniref:Uncharacterized protein n=1 Tax=Nematostella vectensis TaxID=45351 RepID=A7RG57_NEMVE|nr:predicted protein [Nematostella vectensis]|eukprot:XP_001641536.1 predicted protein [Nematostella vectensis]